MKSLKSLRLHIGIFGRTNTGKSSLLNGITAQNVSIVSEQKGTTTDVVEKSMELFPIGPVNFLDTAGLDDETVLGEKRLEKTLSVINRCDAAVIVIDFNGLDREEKFLIDKFNEFSIPYFVVINKSDENKISERKLEDIKSYTENIMETSAIEDSLLIEKFNTCLLKILPDDFVNSPKILSDLVNPKDVVILVTPIDKEAPKGRLILPQVQTLRECLDEFCITVVVKETELKDAIENLKVKPKLVITDSQAFKTVDEIVPKDIPLTSFSILFARLKGDLKAFVEGVGAIRDLNENDKVLILESCTHHNIEDDIARVKIPKLLQNKLGFNLNFEYFTGHNFPEIDGYKLIIHCGACMTNRREILSRILIANKKGIPITNYGLVISYCVGILNRATEVFNI
ncbi:[bacterium]|nr:[FeFe] hydrogenase H-cluster maturation GTPase HydF [bacterium]